MTPRRPLLCLSALAGALLLAACGGDDAATDTTLAGTTTIAATTTAAPTTTAATTTTARPATTLPATTTPADGSADLPVATTPADGSADIPVPPPVDTTDAPLLISVEVGLDDAADRIETVPVGSIVTLSILNPSADDEFHLHDYDLGDDQIIPAGQTATFTFVADRTGDFELESHRTEDVLLILRVV
jgi:hypothetical protein